MKQYKHIFRLLVFVLSPVLLNCGDGDGGGSPQADLPAVPKNFKAVVSSGQVTLTWTMQEGVAYQLHYSTTSEIVVTSGKVPKIRNATSPHTFTELTNGTTYHYRLTASSSSGLSRPTNEVSVTPLAVPQNFTAVSLSDRIRLSWTAQDQDGMNQDDITYDIFYSTTAGFDVGNADVTKISGQTPPYDHFGVTGGTTYYYRLRAKAPLGASDLTEEISETSAGPSAASLNFAAAALSRRVTLTWNRQEGVASYDLFYSTTSGFDVNDMDSGTVLKITGVNPPHVHRELTNNTTYYYRLVATTPSGARSDSADEISATPQEVQHISAGYSNTCAVAGGSVKCWGSDPNRITSVQTTSLTVGDGTTGIAAGGSHICAVVNGRAVCWGADGFGQLGNGDGNATATAPVQVMGLTSGVTKISAGLDHSCAVVGGRAWCWGRGRFGRLGNRSNSNASTPNR